MPPALRDHQSWLGGTEAWSVSGAELLWITVRSHHSFIFSGFAFMTLKWKCRSQLFEGRLQELTVYISNNSDYHLIIILTNSTDFIKVLELINIRTQVKPESS